MIKLSILICTMPERVDKLSLLKLSLEPQITAENYKSIEIITDWFMDYNIGVKRNKLLARARGEYVVFIDDDDEISPNYISLILDAIQTKPDCVAINGKITTDGKNEKKWFISRSYRRWFTRNGQYFRTPNHISPVRRELALKAGFPEISHGEDYAYSMRLLPLLKTETTIHEPIYHYKFLSKK